MVLEGNQRAVHPAAEENTGVNAQNYTILFGETVQDAQIKCYGLVDGSVGR